MEGRAPSVSRPRPLSSAFRPSARPTARSRISVSRSATRPSRWPATPRQPLSFWTARFYNISFAQTVGNSPHRFTLDTSGVFAFYYNNGFSESSGDITAALAAEPPSSTPTQPPAASPTPEPSSLILLATSIAGGAFLLFRRRR